MKMSVHKNKLSLQKKRKKSKNKLDQYPQCACVLCVVAHDQEKKENNFC
jgi:hypothetical protein